MYGEAIPPERLAVEFVIWHRGHGARPHRTPTGEQTPHTSKGQRAWWPSRGLFAEAPQCSR